MQDLKIFYSMAFLSFLLFHSGAFGTDIASENKENLPPVFSSYTPKTPLIEIQEIQNEIKKSHQRADFRDLIKIHTRFMALKHTERQWEVIAKEFNVYKWSGQNWHQTLGGYLFYPLNVLELLDSPYTQNLIKRSDMIWAFAISAYHHHPLGQYYLAKTLDMIRSGYTDAERPEFYNTLYQSSLTTLSQHLDHNDACYTLGKSKVDYPYIGDAYNQEEAVNIFRIGTDFRNQLEVVYFLDQTLWPTEYLKLARRGCARAYREAAMGTENFEDKKNLLKKAVKHGYPPALIDLGDLYEKKNDLKTAKACYNEALNKGISEGHIQYGILLVGDIVFNLEDRKKDLFPIATETIEEAAQHFKLAGQANNPEGWRYLFALKSELYKKEPTEDLMKDIYTALVEGIKLGSDTAYHLMSLYFPEKDHPGILSSLSEVYGYPPQERLYQQIEQYWKSIK